VSAPERETMEVDVLFVGAGPATLASAYHLVETRAARGLEAPSVLVIEKGAEVGDHMLSGAAINPRAIADPYQVVTWTTPEGGEGPDYTQM
jgi:electron-transferring-flavoprotein dehydrogenase